MYTKPRNGDYVTDGLIRGFVIGTGGIPYQETTIPAYKVRTPAGTELMPMTATRIINRDGLAWPDWLRLYRHRHILTYPTR